MQDTVWLEARDGRFGIDPGTGGLLGAVLGDHEFVGAVPLAGLVRLAMPVDGYSSHYLETGVHGSPSFERTGEGVRVVYDEFVSAHVTAPIRVEVDLRAAPEGLVLRARVHNGSDRLVPQVAFPQLLGLAATGGDPDTRIQVSSAPAGHPPRVRAVGTDETRLRLSRSTLWPLHQLAMRPDDASFLATSLQRYYGYGAFEFSMKWFDYGDYRAGLTMYSRDPRYTTQGLLVERPDRAEKRIDLRWLHFPHIAPGETWDSGEFVLLLHEGDWYAGAEAFREFAAEAYPYNAPRSIREALGIRTVWPATRGAAPNFTIDRLPEYAAEIADPDLGLAELSVWHWWEKNGLPIFLDPRLGEEKDLREAIRACGELGVAVSLFVSHRILREESPLEWKRRNAAGQLVQDDWTYGRDFLPRWRVSFVGSHAMVRSSLLSPGYREAIVAEYEKMLELGTTSIMFDQFWAWYEPDYNPSGDGKPDEEGERLLELGRRLQAMVHSNDERGTLACEMLTELKVPMIDYTWEWRNAAELDEDAPFRYVFPQVRLNANVNEHPRGALLGFADGGLLNLMPGNMNTYRLADCPELVDAVRKLAALRRRYLRYFTEGRYHHVEGLTASACHARVYAHGDDLLVIAVNPTDAEVSFEVSLDPAVWGGASRTGSVVRLDGTSAAAGDGLSYAGTLGADDLVVLELVST